MSYSNHTTNYNLPLYVGTDKPTYLGDFNSAMGTIDSQMKTNADTASAADTKATTATTNIGTMSGLSTTEKSTLVGAINEVNTKAGTAQTTANTASAKATANEIQITKLETYLDLTNYNDLTQATSSNGAVNNVDIHVANNADGTVGKIYGYIDCTPTSATSTTITLSQKSLLRPTQSVTINSLGVATNASGLLRQVDATIETDGTIKFAFFADDTSKYTRLIIHPSLLFMVDFGDVPTPTL